MSPEAYAEELAKLSDAKLAKKIRHLRRMIDRGIRTGFLQRNIDHLASFYDVAVTEARRRVAKQPSASPR